MTDFLRDIAWFLWFWLGLELSTPLLSELSKRLPPHRWVYLVAALGALVLFAISFFLARQSPLLLQALLFTLAGVSGSLARRLITLRPPTASAERR